MDLSTINWKVYLNLAGALVAAILPVVSQTPGVPSEVTSVLLVINAVLHQMPDVNPNQPTQKN